MRGLEIRTVDREVELGKTKVLLHNPTPIDGRREHLATVVKIADNGNINVDVETHNGTVSVTAVKGGEIPDDRMAWWSFQVDDPDDAA